MATSLILLAGMLSAPTVDVAFSRHVQQNYPPWAVYERQQTAYAVELTVLPDGRVALCRVLESVGNARLAAETCAGTVGFRLEHAVDSEGKPVHGKLRTTIVMRIEGGQQTREVRAFAPAPDIELSVNRLPDNADSLDIKVVLLVSSEGHVTGCEGREMRNKVPPAEYVAAACEQARGWRGAILYDADDMALPYVTNLTVRFGRTISRPAN